MQSLRNALIGALLGSILAVTALPAAAPVPGVDLSPFGAQIVWPNQPNLDEVINAMEQSGGKWARFDLCWWGQVETTRGVYNFNPPGWPTDYAVQQLVQRGIEVYPILSYGNNLYDTIGNEWVGPYTESGRTGFANYAYAAADRYKDSITYWEIWNEPNLEEPFWGTTPNARDYALLVAATAPRIREANPDAKVIGGVTSEIPFDYLETAFQNGMLEHIDVLSIHPYRYGSPESVSADYQQLRTLMARYSTREIPIWSGEWGYSVHAFNLSEQGQAKIVARQLVNNLSEGIELSIWFSMHPWSTDPTGRPTPEWGLIYLDNTPRPAFHAFKTAVERLYAPVEPVDDPFSTQLSTGMTTVRREFFRHADADHVTAAFWVPRWPVSDSYAGVTRNVTMTVPEGLGISACDGLTGDPVPLNLTRNGTQVQINNLNIRDYPVYIVFEPLAGVGDQASVPGTDLPATMDAGRVRICEITFQNTGSNSWTPNVHLATSKPRGRTDSPFRSHSWPAADTATQFLEAVNPNQAYTLTFDALAPRRAASHSEGFELRRGNVWFDGDGDDVTWNVEVADDPEVIYVEAENFDEGAEGTAYSDLDALNLGDNPEWLGRYRQTGVDLGRSDEGDYMVGWINPGEWLRYTGLAARPGIYEVEFRVASEVAGGALHLEVNGSNATGTVTFPATGGWRTWSTFSAGQVELASSNNLRLVMEGELFNISWMRFTLKELAPAKSALLVY